MARRWLKSRRVIVGRGLIEGLSSLQTRKKVARLQAKLECFAQRVTSLPPITTMCWYFESGFSLKWSNLRLPHLKKRIGSRSRNAPKNKPVSQRRDTKFLGMAQNKGEAQTFV